MLMLILIKGLSRKDEFTVKFIDFQSSYGAAELFSFFWSHHIHHTGLPIKSETKSGGKFY